MSIIENKSFILSEIKKHYGFKTDSDFARFLGIKPTTLSSWTTRNSFDYELIYSKCVGIDANWLFTGKGNMFLNNINTEKKVELETQLMEKEDMIRLLKEQLRINQNYIERLDKSDSIANNANV